MMLSTVTALPVQCPPITVVSAPSTRGHAAPLTSSSPSPPPHPTAALQNFRLSHLGPGVLSMVSERVRVMGWGPVGHWLHE